MTQYDFRKYHIHSINAATDAERAAINQELKDLYEALLYRQCLFVFSRLPYIYE